MPPFPAPLIVWSGATDRGTFRANNEDVFLALAFDHDQLHRLSQSGQGSLAESDFAFAVSDGMGGARSGEFASRITIDKVTRLLPRGFRRTAGGTQTGFVEILAEVVAAIHKELIELGRSYEECRGMGATLSMCWFTPGRMYFSHVGDSRIYRLAPGGKMEQLSHDHSHVGWLRREGAINEREARVHPQRNALQMVLGAGLQFVTPQLGGVPCGPGDRFLICSDGVTDGLWDRRIEEVLRAPPGEKNLGPAIVEEAVAASGRDNATAIVIDVLAAADA